MYLIKSNCIIWYHFAFSKSRSMISNHVTIKFFTHGCTRSWNFTLPNYLMMCRWHVWHDDVVDMMVGMLTMTIVRNLDFLKQTSLRYSIFSWIILCSYFVLDSVVLLLLLDYISFCSTILYYIEYFFYQNIIYYLIHNSRQNLIVLCHYHELLYLMTLYSGTIYSIAYDSFILWCFMLHDAACISGIIFVRC